MITASVCEECYIFGICVAILISTVLLILITMWWCYKGELFKYICTYLATHMIVVYKSKYISHKRYVSNIKST